MYQLHGFLHLAFIGQAHLTILFFVDSIKKDYSQSTLKILSSFILFATYVKLSKLFLLLLIFKFFNLILFSHIFTKVEEKSNEIWKFQMYFLTMEFDNKTALIPPLSIIHHLYLFFKLIARKTCCKKTSKGKCWKKVMWNGPKGICRSNLTMSRSKVSKSRPRVNPK